MGWHRQGLEWHSCKPRNAKDWQPLPGARKRQERILPCRFQAFRQHLDFRLLASRTVRQISVGLSHLVCSTFATVALGKWYISHQYYPIYKGGKEETQVCNNKLKDEKGNGIVSNIWFWYSKDKKFPKVIGRRMVSDFFIKEIASFITNSTIIKLLVFLILPW